MSFRSLCVFAALLASFALGFDRAFAQSSPSPASPAPATSASPSASPAATPAPAASASPAPSASPPAAAQAPAATEAPATAQAAEPFGEPITLDAKKVVIAKGNANWIPPSTPWSIPSRR